VKKGVETRDLEEWPSEKQIEDFVASPCDIVLLKSSKLINFLKAVHKYSPAFDVFIQQQPFLAAIAWGSCRFVVQARPIPNLLTLASIFPRQHFSVYLQMSLILIV